MNSYLEENRGFMTASKLKTFIKDPYAYYMQYEHNDGFGHPDWQKGPTSSMLFGTLVDDCVSYGWDYVHEKYQFCEKRKAVGDKPRFTPSEYEKLKAVVAELDRQELFKMGKAVKQDRIEAIYKADAGDVPIAGTIDRADVNAGWIDDTKTTGVTPREDFVKGCYKSAKKFDYEFSMAFYAFLFNNKYGFFPKKVTLSFIGTNEPYKFLQFNMPVETLQMRAATDIQKALEYYALFKSQDHWPHGDPDNNFGGISYTQGSSHLQAPNYSVNPKGIQFAPIAFLNDDY